MDFAWAPWAGATVTAVVGALGAFYRAHNLITDLRSDLSLMKGKMDERFYNAREERLAQLSDATAGLKAYSDTNRRAVDMTVLGVQTQLQNFQLRVLEEFVRNPALKDCEGRIMMALEKMETKIDRITDRGSGP